MLKSLAAGAALWEPACGAPATDAPEVRRHRIVPPEPVESPIRIENRLPGSSDFKLQRPARDHEVEGYASTTSAGLGDTVEVRVNVSRAQNVRWDLYRIGHYQGLGARLISSGAPARVLPQPEPNLDSRTGLLECSWATAFTLTVDPSWLTGYYLIKLITDDGYESHVPLVVRESGRRAPLLMQANVTCWQAYNLWGGINLYVNHLPGDPQPFTGPRGYQVSFDRPYTIDPDVSALVEHSMVRWLEKQGYDVAYVTNIDIDSTPEVLEGRKLYLVAGHDEYWSLAERNALVDARDRGLSMAFFSGNNAYRRIRLEPSSAGVPQRVITCYKSRSLDPIHDAPDCTADYQSAPYPQPENGMLGVLWAGWGTLEGFPFIVTAPNHWLYEGTGVKTGESLGNVVGYEWDVSSDNGSSPAGLEIVASSPALHEYGYTSQHHATVFYPTSTSFVFAAGTIGWARGLYDERVENSRVQRVTENVLARAGLFPDARVEQPVAPAYERGLAVHSRVLAGHRSQGQVDGRGGKARFRNPSGLALGPDGDVYVCDTGNNAIRRVTADGSVSTVFGKGGIDGIKLDTPTSLAFDASGRLFISDTGSSRILCLDNDGHATVYAGHAHQQHLIDDADPANARFNLQRGITVAPNGALYVADFRNHAIRCIDPETRAVTTVLRWADGPTAVAVAKDGTIYYLASYLGAIVAVTPDGERTILANQEQTYGDRGGPGALAALRPADGLILTGDGLVFTDTGNNRVRALALGGHNHVVTFLGNGHGGDRVGLGFETELAIPRSVVAVPDGYVVADTANHRLVHFNNDPAAFYRQ